MCGSAAAEDRSNSARARDKRESYRREWVANAVFDNNYPVRNEKPKPHFVLENGELRLTNVPVPRVDAWDAPEIDLGTGGGALSAVQNVLFRSHLLYDLVWRAVNFGKVLKAKLAANDPAESTAGEAAVATANADFALTARLLRELRDDVRARGAEFVVFAIPDREQFAWFGATAPYQREIERICGEIGVEYADLTESVRRTFRRTYYRRGLHWTPFGHRRAAAAILAHLLDRGLVRPGERGELSQADPGPDDAST